MTVVVCDKLKCTFNDREGICMAKTIIVTNKTECDTFTMVGRNV